MKSEESEHVSKRHRPESSGHNFCFTVKMGEKMNGKDRTFSLLPG